MHQLIIVGFFTMLIHLTEALAYSMRLAGVRTRQIAIGLSFVTSTLLVSRLSNMFQAPLLGAMVDSTVMSQTVNSVHLLEMKFRVVILCAFVGSFMGMLLTPTMVDVFAIAIQKFSNNGSVPRLMISVLHPRRFMTLLSMVKRPRLSSLRGLSWMRLPKGFLILNMIVTSVYTIGVLCSLLAGASLPEFRSTAIQLSGIVNGMATILFTLFVDPSGARITDQAVHGIRPESDVKAVVFYLQMGRMIGTLILAQLFLMPFTAYILWVTRLLARWAM
jgi:hypothetical protein